MNGKHLLSTLVLVTMGLAACAHEEHHATTARVPEPRTSGPAPSGPSQYVVADPGPRTSVVPVALGGGGGLGLVVDRARIVAGRGEPKVGPDAPDAAIVGAARIPTRLGSGFLFWTSDTFYRADAFDGNLRPVAKVPDSIERISFGPKFLLVRTHNGERWALSLPSGAREKLTPLGAVDVEALDDGRALAFDLQGAVFSSIDGGAHWTDVTAQVRSAPQACTVVNDELWLYESSGAAQRLEPDGHLAWFDKQPEEKPLELRAHDPRWHSAVAPLREALRGGALLDDSTAVVVAEGDIVRIDLHSGDIVGVVPGKAPPDAMCDAVPGTGDPVFACVKRSSGASGMPESFVLTHVLSGEPVIEATFQGTTTFFASDDGGLVVPGPCNVGPTSTINGTQACVRQPGGTWIELDAAGATPDAGPGTNLTVSRWVPRADGRAVALLSDPPGVYDPRTGSIMAWPDAARDALNEGFSRLRFGHKRRIFLSGDRPVDTSWTFTSQGTLRAMLNHGGILEVGEDGKVTRSPYALDVVSFGPNALGRTADGRLYQSTDHGATWGEVAGPPSGATSLELHACSAAGCDLGAFYRIGWAPRPPRADGPPVAIKPAPEVRREKPLELTCRPTGGVASKLTARTDRSPEDLGLGATKLPVSTDTNNIGFLRMPVPKAIANPIHDVATPEEYPSLRAMLSGYSTQRDSDVIQVVGAPFKSAAQLRRAVAFVPPFDPAAPIRRTAIAMSDVLSAGRAIGMATEEILQDDLTETLSVIPVTPSDPGAAVDVLFHNPRGLVVHARSGSERVRVVMRQTQNGEGTVISAAQLPGDDLAVLELEPSGIGHVYRMGGGVTTDLFDVSPTLADATFYPANPDAVAIGPKGEVAILRLASGSDPASAWDPALLMLPAMPPVALAPWSTVRFADDPACKAESGWRATIQVNAPWVRVATPALRVEDVPMIARVKWNEKRVCLEAFEVRLGSVQGRARRETASEQVSVSSWLIGRGSTFARVGLGEGIEWRQALECSIAP